MPDTTTIERRAKDHPEVAEQEREQDRAAAEAIVHEEETPEPEPILVDGEQLAFEGFSIDQIVSRLVGDTAIDPNEGGDRYEKKGSLVRIELTAKLREVRIRSKRVGSVDREVRDQMYQPHGPIECFEMDERGMETSHKSRADLMQRIWDLEDEIADLRDDLRATSAE